MINEKVLKALNRQIHLELQSAYTYLAMAAHFEAESLPGFASWMRHQSQEEVNHAMRLFDHVVDRGGRVVLEAIDQPASRFGKPLEVFQKALEHERQVTESIHRLYEVARAENDYPAQVQLHWFIDEQVEEENTTETIVDRLRRAGDNDAALLMLDEQLGNRNSGG